MCIYQIAKYLTSDGENVWTVCYENRDGNNEYDGIKVIKIKPSIFLEDNQSSLGLKRKIHYLESLLSKLIYLKKYPLRSKSLINSLKNAVEGIIKEFGSVKIIASYTLLEALIAAALLKDEYPEKVKIIYYSADTVSNEVGNSGFLSAEYRTKAGIRWEKCFLERFDKILIMECHESHYFTAVFREFQSKFEVVNFPLLIKNSKISYTKKHKSEKVKLVYAGTLYQKLRNPKFLIDILLNLSKRCEIEAIFMGGGDCEKIMRKAEIDSSGSIKYLGMQSYGTVIDYLNSADVLLSIGNMDSPMAPSKIFEYMSIGKPIIHTYTYDKDPCLVPLRKYRNAKLISVNKNCPVVEVIDYIKDTHLLEYEDIEKSLSLRHQVIVRI